MYNEVGRYNCIEAELEFTYFDFLRCYDEKSLFVIIQFPS